MAHGLAISRLAEVDALSNTENASVPQSLALLRPPGQWRQSTCHTTRCAVVGPIGHYRQHAATVPLGATQNRNKCPFIYVSMRVRVHMRLFTRAVELDRARAGTGPLRTHSQWSGSCASVQCINTYAINYLTRMVFMQILRMYVVRTACSRRASPEDSTDKPTMARSPSKRLGEYLYGYI